MLHRLPSIPLLCAGAALLGTLFAAVTLSAADTDTPAIQLELQQETHALYPQLLQNDLWSAVMWEAWAAEHMHHAPATFLHAGVEMLGSAAYAVPESIKGFQDRGTFVEIVTDHRWYCLGVEGHPIQLPQPLGMNGEVKEAAFSYDTGVVALANYVVGTPDTPPLTVNWTVRTLTTRGAEVMTQSGTEEKVASFRDTPMMVAEDGTAVVQVFLGTGRPSYGVLTTKANGRHVIDNVLKTYGVGPQGRWVLVQSHPEEGPTLIQGDKRTLLRAAAVGPGLAAIVLDNGQAQWLGADGEAHSLVLPVALGKNARLLAVSGYLVVSSGTHAISLDNTDFFGEPLANPPEQPEMCACIPWESVKAGTMQNAVSFAGACSSDSNRPGWLFVWKDRQCWTADLTQHTVVRRPFYQAPDHIGWVSAMRFWDRVEFGQSSSAVVDEDGKELWSGQGYVDPWSPTCGILGSGDNDTGYSIVHYAPDPKQRTTTRLSLDAGSWEFTFDPFNRIFVCSSAGHYVVFDDTGKQLTASGRRVPESYAPWFPPGRFYICGSRLVLRDAYPQPPPVHPDRPTPEEAQAQSEEFSRTLVPVDAWITGRNSDARVLVLHAAHRVWRATPPSRHHPWWSWMDMGSCPGSTRFGTASRGDALFVLGKEWLTVVKSVADGELTDDFAGTKAVELPDGPWQCRGPWEDFAPRGLNSMRWSPDAAGFMPEQLRSPPDYEQGLLVVTPSVVLILARDQRVLGMVCGSTSGRNRR